MLTSAEIRALRPAVPERGTLDAFAPPATSRELEREPDGTLLPAVTVFLVGAECPFTCVFCDLWRHTLAGATPPGALPRQLEAALSALPPGLLRGRIKLYNASNFFDDRAVPEADWDALAALVEPFERVVVECHARLVGDRALAFAERLGGRLELALGLEVADDEALGRIGKQMTLADFERATALLRGAAIPFRVFVLVGAPYAADREVHSARHAFARGAERVALIPTRGGNGAMERLRADGVWRAPGLGDLEQALDAALVDGAGPVSADLWDLERLAECARCFEARRERLARINVCGQSEPRVRCGACAV